MSPHINKEGKLKFTFGTIYVVAFVFLMFTASNYFNALTVINAQVNACERSNIARTQQIHLYQSLINGNAASADAWRFYRRNIAIPGQETIKAPVVAFSQKQVRVSHSQKNELKRAEQLFIGSQSSVSLHPDSSNPYKAIQVDCNAANPKPWPF